MTGDGYPLGPLRLRRPAHDRLLGEPVDEVRAVDIPAEIEPNEAGPAAVLDRDDLAEQNRRILDDVVAWLNGDRHATRTEVARQNCRVGVEIDRALDVAGRRAEPAPDIDLVDRAAQLDQSIDHPRGRGEGRLERRQAVGQPA